jgi:hypothetical protein
MTRRKAENDNKEGKLRRLFIHVGYGY